MRKIRVKRNKLPRKLKKKRNKRDKWKFLTFPDKLRSYILSQYQLGSFAKVIDIHPHSIVSEYIKQKNLNRQYLDSYARNSGLFDFPPERITLTDIQSLEKQYLNYLMMKNKTVKTLMIDITKCSEYYYCRRWQDMGASVYMCAKLKYFFNYKDLDKIHKDCPLDDKAF